MFCCFFLFWLVCTMFCHDVCLDASHLWTYDNMTALAPTSLRARMPHDDVKWHGACCKGPSPWWMPPPNPVRCSPSFRWPQVMKVQVDLCCWCPLTILTGRCWWVMLTFAKKYPSYLILGWRNQGNRPWYFPGKREVHHGLICHWGSLEPLAGWLDAHQRIDWYGTPSFGHSGFDLPKGLGCLDGWWWMQGVGLISIACQFGTWGM